MSDTDSEGGFDTQDKHPKLRADDSDEEDFAKTSFISRGTKLAADDDVEVPLRVSGRRESAMPSVGRSLRASQPNAPSNFRSSILRDRSLTKAFKDKTEKLL